MLPACRLLLKGNFQDSDPEVKSELSNIADQKDSEN